MNPVFPGATQCSRVSLYDDLGTGICGGTPHLHTACTEAYIWIRGEGAVELLSTTGHHVTPMTPFSVVWFSPGVIHRGVPSAHGTEDAEVLVLMQNAGLPESGDAVITLPERLWGEPEVYRETVDVSAQDVGQARELVCERRALAMEGFHELVESVDRLGPSGLDGFYRFAHRVVRPQLAAMTQVVEDRVAPEVATTRRVLEQMRSGSFDHLRAGDFCATAAPSDPLFGMCGDLRPLPITPDE